MDIIGVNVKLMKEKGLTPNEVFFLKGLCENVEFTVGNICNINYLHSLDYVDDTGLITEKGKTITKALFRNNRSFTPPTTDDIKELANQFREFFPKGVKTNNHPVRGNMTNIIRKMRKFKTEFPQYDNDTILKATEMYVKAKAKENYAFMKVSEYLIYKDGISMLASLCDAVLEDEPEKNVKWGRHI